MENNYVIDSMSILLDDFKNNPEKTYRYLFENSYHLDMKFFDVINQFMVKAIDRPSKMCVSHTDCVYGEASRNYRFRFMIFKTEDDYVLVTFKIVDPRSSTIENYFSISYEPISLNDKSIYDVVEALREYPSIKSIEIGCDEKEYSRNNYYNIRDDYREMTRAKWRSKRGINKLKEFIRVDYHSEDLPNIRDILDNIFEMWCTLRGKKVSNKTDRGMLDIAMKLENSCIITFWYKDIPIGITIGTPTYGNYITIYTQKSLGISNSEFLKSYLKEDNDGIIEDILKYLGSYVQYCINKYCFDTLGVKAVFYTGDQRDVNLRRFKQIYYKNTVNYKRIPFSEYIVKEE